METKKILVIEDNQKHLADAKAFFTDKPEYEVEYIQNGRDAMNKLGRGNAKQYNFVITDLFLPFHETFPLEMPIGLGLAMMCKEQGVRCPILTAGWHHGQKYQWVHELVRNLGMVMIGSPTHEVEEVEEKLWRQALDAAVLGRCSENEYQVYNWHSWDKSKI